MRRRRHWRGGGGEVSVEGGVEEENESRHHHHRYLQSDLHPSWLWVTLLDRFHTFPTKDETQKNCDPVVQPCRTNEQKLHHAHLHGAPR